MFPFSLLSVSENFTVNLVVIYLGAKPDTGKGGAKHPRAEADRGAGSLGGESSSSSVSCRAEFAPFRENAYLGNVNNTHVRPSGAGSRQQPSDDVVRKGKREKEGKKTVRDCCLLRHFFLFPQASATLVLCPSALIDFYSVVWPKFVDFIVHLNKCRWLA